MGPIGKSRSLLICLVVTVVTSCMPEEQEFIKPTPIALSPTEITTTSFIATWKPLLGAEMYQLEVSTSSTFEEQSVISGASSTQDTSYVLENLIVAKSYYYRLKARLRTGELTDYSNLVEATTLGMPAPVGLSATEVKPTSFIARWRPVDEAKTYTVEIARSIDFADALSIQQLVTEDSFVIVKNGLKVDEDYFYRVIAKDGDISSTFSNVIHVTTTQLTQPVLLGASDSTQTQFTVNWEPVLGAADYTIDIAKDPLFLDSLTFVVSGEQVNEPTYTIGSLDANTDYYYRVRADNDRSFSGYSVTGTVTTLPLDVPVALAATEVRKNEFIAHWRSVTMADNYTLEVATDEHFTQPVDGYASLLLNDTSVSVTGLRQSTTYYYRVRANGLNAQSLHSVPIELTTLSLPSPVAYEPANLGSTTFTAIWASVDEADTYQLEVATDPDFLSGLLVVKDISDTSFSVQELMSDKTYYYRVRAKQSINYSPYSNIISQYLVALEQPVSLVSSNITYTSFTSSWNVVPEAEQYVVEVASDDQFATMVPGFDAKVISGTSIDITGLDAGTTYYLRVKAQSSYAASEFSEPLETTTASVAAPTAQQPISADSYTVHANWSLVPDASGYLLDISTSADFATIVTGYENVLVEATHYYADNLQPATTYYYRVKAVVSGYTSEYSNSISVSTSAGNTWLVPEMLEAEVFSVSSGVDRVYSPAGSGEYYVSSVNNEDWVEYEIDAQYTDTYIIKFRVASNNIGGTINIRQGGSLALLGTVNVTDTGGWENWTTVMTNISLAQGVQNIRIEFVGSGSSNLFNVDRIDLESTNF